MEYKEKLGTITRVGPKKTEFNDGRKVTIGGRNGAPSYPGVSVGVQFDFDKDVWYSGILFEKQAESLAEGKQINVKVWEKESGGKIYKNFSVVSEKKAAEAKVNNALSELIHTVDKHSKQILALYEDLKKIKGFEARKETVTAFDDDYKDHFPEEAAQLENQNNITDKALEEYNSIEAFSKAAGLDIKDDHLDISPDDIDY